MKYAVSIVPLSIEESVSIFHVDNALQWCFHEISFSVTVPVALS